MNAKVRGRKLQGNHAETAQLLGVTAEGLRKMVRDRGCPAPKDGSFDWPSVVRWRIEDAATGRGALTDARTALAKAQATKVQRENAVANADLVSVAAAGKAWGQLILIFRNAALGMGSRLGAELVNVADAHVAKSIIDRYAHEMLTNLAENHGPAGMD